MVCRFNDHFRSMSVAKTVKDALSTSKCESKNLYLIISYMWLRKKGSQGVGKVK